MDTKIRPIGRIDILYRKNSHSAVGAVGERCYYYDEKDFLKAVKEQNYYGVPMIVNVYRDENGNTIPLDFVLDFDPPVQGFYIIDYEGEFENDKSTERFAA